MSKFNNLFNPILVMLPIVGEVYQHHKGNRYRVLFIGKLNSDLSDVVIYQGNSGQVWVRTVEDFMGTVKIDENEVPRFQLVRPGA